MRRLVMLVLILASACSEEADPLPVAPSVGPPPASGCETAVAVKTGIVRHVATTQTPRYDTEPPTWGDHFDQWAETGVYETAVPDGKLVHNLEHGQVIIWVNGLDAEQIAALHEVAASQREWIIVMPRPTMTGIKVAFSAWGTLQRCAQAPENLEERARDFFDRFAQRAPETVPGRPLG